jgi:hypothetical protein
VTQVGFEIQMDEWDYLDGSHTTETIDYLAVIPGSHVIGGLKIEAAAIPLTHSWTQMVFAQGFTQLPVVFSQIASDVENEAAITRIRNISTNSVQIKIDEEEKNDRQHLAEQVHIIAIEPGSGSVDGKQLSVGRTANDVDHVWRLISFPESMPSPLFLGGMQTTNGGDPATVRYRNLNNNTVETIIHEEKSANTEVKHVKESIGWMLVEQ